MLLALLAVLLCGGCSGQQRINAFVPHDGYTLNADLVYDAARDLRLDVYAPKPAHQAPVVVFFHGGRWSEGSKDGYRFVGQALAEQGFVAVIPNYRLYPSVRFPAFVHDAAQALRWTHDHIPRYGGDSTALFVMGHSAGAHLAAMLALDDSYLRAAGSSRAWLSGMIGLAGPYDFLPLEDADLRDIFGPPERYQESQPIYHVDGKNPPLLLVHGENDTSVNIRNTRNLATAVRLAGGVVETIIYPKMSHTWIIATLAAPLRHQSDVLEQVSAFIRTHAKNKQPGAQLSDSIARPGVL